MSTINAIAGNTAAMDENMKSLGQQTGAYAKTNKLFDMMGGDMQDQVQGAASLTMATQALAQSQSDAAAGVPDDAETIRKAQQAINQSLQTINNLFTKLAVNILVPFLDATAYILEGLGKLGTVVGTILNPAFP